MKKLKQVVTKPDNNDPLTNLFELHKIGISASKKALTKARKMGTTVTFQEEDKLFQQDAQGNKTLIRKMHTTPFPTIESDLCLDSD